MTQEDINLLLKDLSARLYYGVICQVDEGAAGLYDGKLVEIDISKEFVRFNTDINCYRDAYIDDVKPYLRPMSSMTEEERVEYFYNRMTSWAQNEFGESYTEAVMQYRIDFLLEHHFDYRGLIEKGLALEAPEGMYN